MKQSIGALAFFMGIMGLMGLGGYVTEVPPEATTMDWIKIAGLTLNFGILAQLGIWLIKEEI